MAESARADQDQLRTAQKERQARVAKVIVGLAIAVILMLFIIFNSKPARVSFVFATGHPPLIWVMFSCAVLGGILGYLVGRPGRQVNLRRHPKDERKS